MPTNYEIVKAWRKANPEKVAAQARRYRAKHPDKVSTIKRRYRQANLEEIREKDAARQRDRRAADPEAQQERQRSYAKRQEELRTEIAGRPRADRCDICDAEGKTVFDHCHTEGHFRGWICDRCNRVLGSVYDDDDLLIALALYVRRNRGQVDSEKAELTAKLKLRRSEQKLPSKRP